MKSDGDSGNAGRSDEQDRHATTKHWVEQRQDFCQKGGRGSAAKQRWGPAAVPAAHAAPRHPCAISAAEMARGALLHNLAGKAGSESCFELEAKRVEV
jgi:hypothetical protein